MAAPSSQAGHIDPALSFWQDEWDRVSVQLDNYNSVIRITFDTWFELDQNGRNFFVNQASISLKKPAEFFQDNTNQRRIVLANRQDLQAHIPCHIEPLSQHGLPRFFPTMRRPFNGPSTGSQTGHIPINMHFGGSSVNMNINSYGRAQSQQAGPSVSFPPARNFNVHIPVNAPPYPMPQMNIPVQQAPINNGVRNEARSSKRRNASGDKKDKRPSNGWIVYRASRSRAVLLENPGLEIGDISKLLSAEWAGMSELQRDPYHERADELALKNFEENPDTQYKPNLVKIAKRRAERAEREAAPRALPDQNLVTPNESQTQPENLFPPKKDGALFGIPQQVEIPQLENMLDLEGVEALFGFPEEVELPQQVERSEQLKEENQ
ncbi:hypothetical protein F5Y03DRAFT_404575 [Xylaria venustula]|nr:hypothetical protein F5Y03DRAFT_404575 [Xylaria venustula]